MHLAKRSEVGPRPEVGFRARPAQAHRLTERDRDQALAFLGVRPLHTVILAGWVLDHGVVSPLHRGAFYGYRNCAGELQGVALIGRNTLFEVRTEEAMIALATLARRCGEIKMVMAEAKKLTKFWRYYARPDQFPRVLHHNVLFATDQPALVSDPVEGLRLATLGDLDLVVAAHAGEVARETGENHLQTDADAFRARCAARVERGRVWILREGDDLVFKVDILTQAAGISYIEGVWVNPAYRRRGICQRALKSLQQELLTKSPVVCCFAELTNQAVQNLYLKSGYSQQSIYSKIYL